MNLNKKWMTQLHRIIINELSQEYLKSATSSLRAEHQAATDDLNRSLALKQRQQKEDLKRRLAAKRKKLREDSKSLSDEEIEEKEEELEEEEQHELEEIEQEAKQALERLQRAQAEENEALHALLLDGRRLRRRASARRPRRASRGT